MMDAVLVGRVIQNIRESRKQSQELVSGLAGIGRTHLSAIERGDISGMSFAFTADEDDSENGVSYEKLAERSADGKDVWIRHVKRITALYDVSIVTHPAYEQTSVGTREQAERIDKAIEEQIKREEGGGESEDERKAREAKEAEQKENDKKNRMLLERAKDIRKLTNSINPIF